MNNISLIKATINDIEEIYNIQIVSFRALLDKYQDYDFSPGAEKIERTMQRFNEPITDYYIICKDNIHIGAIRIRNFDTLVELKQIFILPEYQGYDYSQKVMILVESLYPNAKEWQLDTILQEKKLCYLYEKMGYKKTGKIENIKEGMDIVFYAK